MSSLSSKLAVNPASEAFASATLSIVTTDQTKGAPFSLQSDASKSVHNTCAYYRDSSGRARVHARVRLYANNGGIESLLECNCIHPTPVESSSLHSCNTQRADDDMAENNDGEKSTSQMNDGEPDWRDELSTIGKEVGDTPSPWFVDTSFTFECSVTSSSTGRTVEWAVEQVSILHSEIERNNNDPKSRISGLLFDVELAIRGNGLVKEGVREMLEEGQLELRAVLRQRNKYRGDEATANVKGSISNTTKKAVATKPLLGGKGHVGVAAGLLGLELGGGALSPKSAHLRVAPLSRAGPTATPSDTHHNATEMHYRTKIQRTTPPLRINVTLIPPLQLTVREVCGARAASGATLVEITVEHTSKWHSENVTVTGIAFHPGQSRLWEGDEDGSLGEVVASSSILSVNSTASNLKAFEGKSMQGGELSVIDMSRRVRWGFAPGTSPELPLVLGPHEAFATVIQIDAGEDVRSRAFLSPITVNAMVSSYATSSRPANNNGNAAEVGERVMITTDARWTTSRVAVENSDAFRVEMSLRGGLQTVCRVGAPLIVNLRVLNLSMDPRDLMLLMAKDGEGRNSGLQWEKPVEGRRVRTGRGGHLRVNVWGGTMLHNRAQLLQSQEDAVNSNESPGFNTAVVSEVNGYQFGVWGLSGNDDGTTRHHRDHELLAVDAALLLGEVKGQHSIEAELRFVPLREGTLDVPNLKLYDKRGGRWYNCVHTLKIVAAAKA